MRNFIRFQRFFLPVIHAKFCPGLGREWNSSDLSFPRKRESGIWDDIQRGTPNPVGDQSCHEHLGFSRCRLL
jgi:hypothetical protein